MGCSIGEQPEAQLANTWPPIRRPPITLSFAGGAILNSSAQTQRTKSDYTTKLTRFAKALNLHAFLVQI